MACATRLVSVLAVAQALAACATVAPIGDAAGGRTADPGELTQWIAKGRLALTTQGEGGSGSFVWQQRSERTELSVRGPLGVGSFEVVTDGSTLQVAEGSGESIDGEAARQVLEQRLGTSLPLAQLRFWMLGLADPGTPSERHESGAGVGSSGFTQAGWQVTYDGFRTAQGWSLPVRLNAATATARVRIVVDDWQVPAP